MAVLLLAYIAFALLASAITILFIGMVIASAIVVIVIIIIKAVILIVFTVYIEGFRRLLRFIG